MTGDPLSSDDVKALVKYFELLGEIEQSGKKNAGDC